MAKPAASPEPLAPSVDRVPGPLDAIADFAERVEYAHLPADVIQVAKMLLLEGISWMALGVRHQQGGEARRWILS